MNIPLSPTQFVTFIYVSDLKRSHHFYTDVLRLPMTLDQGTCRIYSITDTAFVGICTGKTVKSQEAVILTLVSEDLHNWKEWLLENDVSVTKGPVFKIFSLWLEKRPNNIPRPTAKIGRAEIKWR